MKLSDVINSWNDADPEMMPKPNDPEVDFLWSQNEPQDQFFYPDPEMIPRKLMAYETKEFQIKVRPYGINWVLEKLIYSPWTLQAHDCTI